tara:strand:+ start:72 stop:338 length:267 start_codon:yes stop_codon:yes gene_type:complete
MNIDRAREMAEALIADNETAIATLGDCGDEVAVCLLLRVEKLERELRAIRGCLASQEDKSCLGTGTAKGVAPWSIVDEAIDGITRVLK